jgi:hypothetical protein
MPRGRRNLLLAVAGVLGGLVVAGVLAGGGDNEEPGTDPGEVAAAAGCLLLERTAPVPRGNKHVNGTVDYPQAPPDSGDHAAQTLRNAKRFYSRDDNPSVEQAVHDLEHGLVVAWYDDELPDDQVAILEATSQGMGTRYVVVPWRRSAFEESRHFVLTAWAKTMRCERVSVEVIRQFIEDHADSEDAPEKGYSV